MDYFKILNLNREPFSNSPDPDFFFKSHQHFGCLQKLELSIRLRRGMNVVIGEVGTGKTTLCRQLLRSFADEDAFECHLILDPAFHTANDFLSAVAEMISGEEFPEGIDERRIKESIKKTLFQRGVEKKKIVVLIIDEGQKLPEFCLEIIRELLNYETNEHKLLQIAIFAQLEFEQTLQRHSNFADRINLRYILNPMSFQDTREMIRFRLRQSSTVAKPASLFTYPAIWVIYRATKGYPRKIINLCHQSMLAMIIQNKTRAGWRLVNSCVHRAISSAGSRALTYSGSALVIAIIALILAGIIPTPLSRVLHKSEPVKALAPLPPYHIAENRILALNKSEERQPASTPPVGDISAAHPASQPKPSPLLDAETALPDPEKHVPPATESVRSQSLGENAQPKAPIRPHLPAVLGEITIEAQDTLGELIRYVYGTYQRVYVEAVLSANPHITNPNKVQSGDTITFPVLPVDLPTSTVQRWWIQIDKTGSLGETISRIKSSRTSLPPTLCIPSWSAEAGLEFTIILRDHYFSREKAEARFERILPLIDMDRAKVISGWENGKTYFADPFRGQGY